MSGRVLGLLGHPTTRIGISINLILSYLITVAIAFDLVYVHYDNKLNSLSSALPLWPFIIWSLATVVSVVSLLNSKLVLTPEVKEIRCPVCDVPFITQTVVCPKCKAPFNVGFGENKDQG